MLPFAITFHPVRGRRALRRWVRFYPSADAARADAMRLVSFETCDRGQLVAVEPTEDPR